MRCQYGQYIVLRPDARHQNAFLTSEKRTKPGEQMILMAHIPAQAENLTQAGSCSISSTPGPCRNARIRKR